MPHEINTLLQDYINKKEAISLPYALMTLLSKNDLPDDEALKAAQWCEQQLPDAFQETKGTIPFPKEKDKSKWNEEYYFRHTSYAESNFSMERFEHLVEVRNYLRAQGNELFRRIENPAQINTLQNFPKKPEPSIKKKPLPIGIALLGVSAILIALLILF